jgi:hypothetical protein
MGLSLTKRTPAAAIASVEHSYLTTDFVFDQRSKSVSRTMNYPIELLRLQAHLSTYDLFVLLQKIAPEQNIPISGKAKLTNQLSNNTHLLAAEKHLKRQGRIIRNLECVILVRERLAPRLFSGVVDPDVYGGAVHIVRQLRLI